MDPHISLDINKNVVHGSCFMGGYANLLVWDYEVSAYITSFYRNIWTNADYTFDFPLSACGHPIAALAYGPGTGTYANHNSWITGTLSFGSC